MKTALCVLLIALLFAVSACDMFTPQSPPFAISGFSIKKGEIENFCRTAGVEFYFINTADKEITEIVMSFRLYYSDGGYPDYGDNKVTVIYAGVVSASEEVLISVPLDKYISIYRELSFMADQIIVEKIFYADGSTWSDMLGLWRLGGIK
jgi:hypothetical protein